MNRKSIILLFIFLALCVFPSCITDKGALLPPMSYTIDVIEGSAQFGCDKMKKRNSYSGKKTEYDLFNDTNYNKSLEDIRIVAAGDSYSVLLTQDSSVTVYITPLSTPVKICYVKNGKEIIETIERNSVLGKTLHFDY